MNLVLTSIDILPIYAFFLLDEKESKSQDKTICYTQATLLRVLSDNARFSIKDLSISPFEML